MKKTILAATLLAFTTTAAIAEGQGGDEFSVNTGNRGAGEVIFKGEVKSASCDITVAGQANNAIVKLPIINASEFKAADTKYKRTNFDIVLSNCDLGEDQETVSVSWTDGQLDDNVKGYLSNRLTGGDAAQGVSLVISDTADKNMVPGTHVETQPGSTDHYSNANSTASAKYDKTNKSATIPFTVAYVAADTATVKAGKVESAAVYSVFYE